MIGIMVVSHEPLGTALIRCTRHVFGSLPPQLAALDVVPDEDPQAAIAAARELLGRINDGSGALVFTDCWGATPSRIAAELVAPGRVLVLTGVNLPMLLKAITLRRLPIEELADRLVPTGQDAIRTVEAPESDTSARELPQRDAPERDTSG